MLLDDVFCEVTDIEGFDKVSSTWAGFLGKSFEDFRGPEVLKKLANLQFRR